MMQAHVIRRGLVWIVGAVLLLRTVGGVMAAETIPPKPPRHFNDFAGVVSAETERRLDDALVELEKSDSTQIVVAVYPRMESDTTLEDYTVRVARAWKAGQTNLNNGAILFVFMEDREMRIEVGYGLEGAIPDATAKRIIEDEIIPHFRNGNPEQGLVAGVQAMIAAARGEYQGTGRTVGGGRSGQRGPSWVGLLFLIFIFLSIMGRMGRSRRGYSYRRGGRTVWGGPFIGGFGGGGFGGGGGGFGGGFSGGGGSFGGGGASGRW